MSNNEDNMKVQNVPMGTFFVSKEPIELRTTLGSCISVCIRDPIAGVGGMNHFLLPDSKENQMSAQYGAFSMELLVNKILESGGLKTRLEVKVFGGANVIKTSQRIGEKNQEFILEYLHDEKLKITTKDIGGTRARKLKYYPQTGKALIMKISEKQEEQLGTQETKFSDKTAKAEIKTELEFFD